MKRMCRPVAILIMFVLSVNCMGQQHYANIQLHDKGYFSCIYHPFYGMGIDKEDFLWELGLYKDEWFANLNLELKIANDSVICELVNVKADSATYQVAMRITASKTSDSVSELTVFYNCLQNPHLSCACRSKVYFMDISPTAFRFYYLVGPDRTLVFSAGK